MEGVRSIVVFALVGVFAASMIAAAAIDVRSRRFPNILAAFMSLVAVGLAWSLYSAPVFFTHVCCSIAFLCVLVGFELVWATGVWTRGLGNGRRQGAGDIGFAFALGGVCRVLHFHVAAFDYLPGAKA